MRRIFLTLSLTALAAAYALNLGGTYNGILRPDIRLLSLVVLALFALVWLIGRPRQRLRVPLGGALLLWLLAFGASLLANGEVWRRIAIALWFMGLYLGLWVALSDLIASGRLEKTMLRDGLLIAGLVPIVDGFADAAGWFGQLGALLSGDIAFSLPRPSGTLENPNTLAGVLILLIPLALSRTSTQRGWRIAAWIYVACALALVVLTFSRGAWLGFAAGLVVFVVLTMRNNPAFWPRQIARKWLLLAGIMLLIAGVAGAALLLRSLDIGGRGVDLRSGIWGTAVEMFATKPLTGHGLFTFGRDLALNWSTPPLTPHSHAHNLPLLVAGELGSLGLLALAATILLGLRAIRRNWQEVANRPLLMGATAALVGFGVHHLFDVPAMNPALALAALVVGVLAIAPELENQARDVSPLRGWVFVAAGFWVALLGVGWWGAWQYQQYTAALNQAKSSADYAASARAFAPLIATDPSLAVLYQQQGLLYGVAATYDSRLTPQAIAAYERFTMLEPNYAHGWANLAALYDRAGQQDQALEAMQRAANLAPRSPALLLRLGQMAEAAGLDDEARDAYTNAVTLAPDIQLLSAWNGTGLQQALSRPLTPPGDVLAALENGDVATARDMLATIAPPILPESRYRVMLALAAIVEGDLEGAAPLLVEARALAASSHETRWVHVAEAWLVAVEDGDIDRARALYNGDLWTADDPDGANIARIQFLHDTLERQFIPQVGYFEEAALWALIEHVARQISTAN